jgi:archaetidylinositol phosphate synthase
MSWSERSDVIDGLFKRHIDPLWEKAAQPLARLASANQITVLGLILILASCGAYLLHQSLPWFGLCLALSFATDSLDGAVARLRRESSHFGGYLDAVADRYQEGLVFFTLALHGSAWEPAFLAYSGAMITSYAKARAAIEIPIDNDGWPDLFERQERIIYLCALLLLGPTLAGWLGYDNQTIITTGLWGLAILCHLTAIQRFLRARSLLVAADGPGAAGPRTERTTAKTASDTRS